jgi:hypothetical protein
VLVLVLVLVVVGADGVVAAAGAAGAACVVVPLAGAGVAAGALPGKTELGRLIGALALEAPDRREDLPDRLSSLEDELLSSLAASASSSLGSRPAATASWRARYGLRPSAISWLTSATVGVLADARATDALAATGCWKFAEQFGTFVVE